jgi:sugar phosphate permease/biotin carboxyl carrier protein
MFASTVLNYMDRQSIALVSPQIRREFGVDFEGFGWVVTAFYLTYALFQVPAGFLVDRLNVRRVYAGAVALWSLAAVAIAFSPAVGVLIALRALLGVGESFNWPAALKVTGAILPPRDRSLGNGIFNSGAAVGAVLTPLTVPLLTAWFGWRWAFVMIGVLGFAWVGVWLTLTRGLLAERTEVEGEPSPSRPTTRRARAAFGIVGVAALATIVVGYLRPAPVPVRAEAVRLAESGSLVRWVVEPGAKRTRGDALAEIARGSARFDLLAPADGTLVETRLQPGEPVEPGGAVATLEDPAGRFIARADAFRAASPVRVVRWLVEPSGTVRRGEALAEVRVADSPATLLAERDGVLARYEVAEGESGSPDATLAVLHVQGFDTRGNGLPGLWFGIALLMFGSLAAARVLPMSELGKGGWAQRMGEVVRHRRFWTLVVVSCSINVCWHSLLAWLPTYLQTDRGMTYLAGGFLSALPFLAADAGNLVGGAASRGLALRGMGASRARLLVIAGCAALISAGAWIGRVPAGSNDGLVIGLLALMTLGAAAYMANYFAFCQEVDARHTGLIVGYLGGLGNLLAAGFAPVVGRIKDQVGSFGPVFVVIGLLPFVGLAALALGWGRERVRDEAARTA